MYVNYCWVFILLFFTTGHLKGQISLGKPHSIPVTFHHTAFITANAAKLQK
jgi:hypothetical protein